MGRGRNMAEKIVIAKSFEGTDKLITFDSDSPYVSNPPTPQFYLKVENPHSSQISPPKYENTINPLYNNSINFNKMSNDHYLPNLTSAPNIENIQSGNIINITGEEINPRNPNNLTWPEIDSNENMQNYYGKHSDRSSNDNDDMLKELDELVEDDGLKCLAEQQLNYAFSRQDNNSICRDQDLLQNN